MPKTRHTIFTLANGVRTFTLASIVSAASCIFPTGGCACDPAPQFSMPVSGVVTRASGAAAERILVHAKAFEGTCPVSDSGYVDDALAFAMTDSTGSFSVLVRTFREVGNACVRVRFYTDSTFNSIPVLTQQYNGRRIQRGVRGSPTDSLRLTARLS